MSEYIRSMREKIGHDPLILCGASVIVYKNSKVLLQKRKDDGSYGYIGGCVELYEEVKQAAKRELFEETGLTQIHTSTTQLCPLLSRNTQPTHATDLERNH